MAYSRLLFFSRTRYTLPTSPLPISLILSKLDGPTSTFRTLMEFELYVLLNAIELSRFGGCRAPSPSCAGTAREPASATWSSARATILVPAFCARGSLLSSAVAGRSGSPLPLKKRPWALGALATLLSFRANSSLPAMVAWSLAPDTPLTFSVGVSGGLGGTEPSL